MSGPASTRTRGFLFADLRGYTAFVEAQGDDAAVELLAAYRALVRGVVAQHEGAEIRTEGDSFYVVFPSASAAVRCGLDILQAAKAAAQAGGRPLAVGIGVHAGETAESEAEGLVGSAVNIAARICSVAAPGELLVSDTVRSLTRTSLQVRFLPRGTRRLKGLSEGIVLYRVERAEVGALRGAAPSQAARWRRVLPAGPLGALAGLTIVAILVAVSGFVVYALPQFAQGPSSTPRGSGSVAVSPSPSAPAFPNADEQALLARLPSSVTGGANGPNCRESDPSDHATDATVSIVCAPGGEAAVASVWYDAVADAGQLTSFFFGAEPPGDCSKGTGFQTTWQLPNPIPPNVPFLAGRLRCFQKASTSWIWWTYDSDRIVARAARHDLDWKALWQWWDVAGPALKEG